MISHHCSEFLRLPLMRRYFLLTPDISGAFVLSSHLAGCLGSGMWPRGVTVSTLDPESSNRGSNPRETCRVAHVAVPASRLRCPHRSAAPSSGGPHPSGPPSSMLPSCGSCPVALVA